MTGYTTLNDVAVVGGGIVGLATARAVLRRRPGCRVVVLEKETTVARHQTGHNSGVIHSGIYYRPGSMKARLCLAGNRSMVRFARDHGIPAEVTGKLIVATRPDELDGLDAIERRGLAHGLPVRRLDRAEIAEREPHLDCIAAVHVADTGIVDFRAVARRLSEDVLDDGGEVLTGTRVLHSALVGDVHRVQTTSGELRATVLVNCAGLQSDLVASASGADPPARIVPFRGEYHELRTSARHLVRGLIYPVPNPELPFLGVHLTRGVDGGVHAGPNAVLALAREGYRRRDVSPRELWDTVRSPAFRHLARRHVRTGFDEVVRSLSRRRFLTDLQRLVPDLTAADLVAAPAGVRAQAVRPDGTLVDDFLIVERPWALHVLNTPSPAATSSLEIGAHLARRLLDALPPR